MRRPRVLVEEDLDAGVLVQPFDLALDDPFSFWLPCRNDRVEEPRIRSFISWISEEAAGGR